MKNNPSIIIFTVTVIVISCQRPLQSKKTVIMSTTLQLPAITPLQRDGANFKSWRRTVNLRLNTHGIFQYLESEVEVPKKQHDQLIDFLFSVVDSTILDIIDFDEEDDTFLKLWDDLIEFGSKKHSSKLTLLRASMDFLPGTSSMLVRSQAELLSVPSLPIVFPR